MMFSGVIAYYYNVSVFVYGSAGPKNKLGFVVFLPVYKGS